MMILLAFERKVEIKRAGQLAMDDIIEIAEFVASYSLEKVKKNVYEFQKHFRIGNSPFTPMLFLKLPKPLASNIHSMTLPIKDIDNLI